MSIPNAIYNDLSTVAVWAAVEIDSITSGREKGDYVYVPRLSEILQEHSKSLLENNCRGTLALNLYEAIKQYPNGLCDDSVQRFEDLGEKVKWVTEELKHVSELSKPRIDDLVKFCCALSRETSNYSFKQYLAA